jgi:hypothetical protein
MKLTGEYRSTRRKTCPSATLSATNPTWTSPGSNVPIVYSRYRVNFGSLCITHNYFIIIIILLLRLFYGDLMHILHVTKNKFISAVSVPRSCCFIKAKIWQTYNNVGAPITVHNLNNVPLLLVLNARRIVQHKKLCIFKRSDNISFAFNV